MYNLVYMGDDLYSRSGSVLSPGFVQVALREGKEVHIRQGTEEERNTLVGNYVRRGGFWRTDA